MPDFNIEIGGRRVEIVKFVNFSCVPIYFILSRIVAKFTYSPLSKTFEKQTKIIEDQGIKDTDALKSENKPDTKSVKGFSKDIRTTEITNEYMKLKNGKVKKKKKKKRN